MAITRRQTLAILGGGIVVAASADIAIGPAKALAPWSKAGSYTDPRMNALSYAILSPNPHNRQPWMVDLSKPDEIALYVDTERLLPHTDPFSRQITIGLGCFLETLRMAAAEQGLDARFELFPDGMDQSALDGRRVALVRLSKGGTPDPLFAHVMQRRSQKEPYDLMRPIPNDVLPKLEAACVNGTKVGSTNAPDQVRTLRKISNEALTIEIDTPSTYKESVDLFRIGRAEVNANPDGIDFTGPMFQFAQRFRLFTREAALDPKGSAFQQGKAIVLESTSTAMAHIWLVTEGNSRIDQINTGRDWVRLNLATTAEGVAMQPLSQALQEYPEMADHYAQIHNLLAPEGGTVQMFGRLGYCAPVPESPRWPIEKKILNG